MMRWHPDGSSTDVPIAKWHDDETRGLIRKGLDKGLRMHPPVTMPQLLEFVARRATWRVDPERIASLIEEVCHEDEKRL